MQGVAQLWKRPWWLLYRIARAIGLRGLLRGPAKGEDMQRVMSRLLRPPPAALWPLVIAGVVAGLLVLPAAASAAPAEAPLPPECVEMAHHVLSPFVEQYVAAGMGETYQWRDSVVYVVQVTECGNAWLIAVWRHGEFKSNFIPAASRYAEGFRVGTRAAWAYIGGVVRAWSQVGIETVQSLLGAPFMLIIVPPGMEMPGAPVTA